MRAQVLSLKERAFIEAARALGVPTWKIIVRHLVPNMLGTMLVMASYYIAVTVIAEAGLSFIGLGAQPPTPSLGQMVAEGRKFLNKDPWTLIFLTPSEHDATSIRQKVRLEPPDKGAGW